MGQCPNRNFHTKHEIFAHDGGGRTLSSQSKAQLLISRLDSGGASSGWPPAVADD